LLRNAHYELALSKANGAILALVDRSADADLTLGSRCGCLWGAVFPDADPGYVGGCSYSDPGPNRFDYARDPVQSTLALTYTWGPGISPRVDAALTLAAGTDPFFDLQLALENGWGATLQNALLPSDLLFADDAVQAAYGPFLMPGV
jgi:hypothetical protein